MSDETFETFPAWPRADVPSASITDEFNESAWSREDDALFRHLHETEAEHFGWSAETEPADSTWRWPLGSVPGMALTQAFEYYMNHQHELYGQNGDIIGWSYWAVRDMRNLLNGILERHHVWRREALARGRPTYPSDEEQVSTP